MFIIAGLGPVLTERVRAHFDNDENEMRAALVKDPYVLLDIEGISFKRADQIAKRNFNVFDQNDPRRQKALIRKILRDNTSFGHTFLPDTWLRKEAKKEGILDLSNRLDAMQSLNEIVVEETPAQTRIYDRKLYIAETEAVSYTQQLKNRQMHDATVDCSLEGDPDPDQEKFLREFPYFRISVLTGGPGTGKTYIINNVYRAALKARRRIELAAPTGKAAKRLSEATGGRAKTIHRLLKAGWGFWGHNKTNKLKLDMLVIDESSMIDINLAWRLLQALPNDCQVVFVGDADQLPPVGPGAFFRDLIKSKQVPVYCLRTNHRQGAGSIIAANAIQINQGGYHLKADSDFLYIRADNPIEIRSKLPKVVDTLMLDFDSYHQNIQVLTPQHGTLVGVKKLNEMLRYQVNPKAKANERISLGDKVMHTYNDYKMNLFNGYIGQIVGKQGFNYVIDFFDSGRVTYPMHIANEGGLLLAYASTVHKFQGSECAAGVVIVSSSHTWMLTRNLLYTAITRFKKRCVILGDDVAFKRSITNNKERLRFSRFVERLLAA